MNTLQPTPETDALILARSGFGPTDFEWRIFARRLERERDELRKIFPAILHACDNGSGCTESVSLEFLKEVPAEVRGVVQALKRDVAEMRRERDEAQADLTALREAVKEVTTILAQIPDAYDSRFFRAGQWADAALTKLQPFTIPSE